MPSLVGSEMCIRDRLYNLKKINVFFQSGNPCSSRSAFYCVSLPILKLIRLNFKLLNDPLIPPENNNGSFIPHSSGITYDKSVSDSIDSLKSPSITKRFVKVRLFS